MRDGEKLNHNLTIQDMSDRENMPGDSHVLIRVSSKQRQCQDDISSPIEPTPGSPQIDAHPLEESTHHDVLCECLSLVSFW